MFLKILVGLVVVYTIALIILGRIGARRAKTANFLTGGRQFNISHVFFMISALWCSWVYIVELETAWLFGISAMWFGIAVAIMATASVYALGTPLSKLSFVTNSGIIGDRFGPIARTISALVIGITFPIFAMSNALMAAGVVHVITGLSLLPTMVIIALLVTIYVYAGGIWSLAYTQVVNFIVMAIGLAAAIWLAFDVPSLHKDVLDLPVRFTSWNGIGIGMILVYIAADLLNVVSAQAEFQILLAAKDLSIGKKGTYLSVISIIVFAIGAAFVGLSARAVSGVDNNSLGIFAVPAFLIKDVGSHPIIQSIALLSIWASALTWTAPLMFSGAASLGNDMLKHCFIKESHNDGLVKSCVQWLLPIQAILIVVYALARPDELAWWQVFSLTIRNGAIFAPTIALLFWKGAEKRAAISSIVLGALSGLAWNWIGGFSSTQFFLGINPMWISASVGMLVIVGLSVVFNEVESINRDGIGFVSLAGGLLMFAVCYLSYVIPDLEFLAGIALCSGILLTSISVMRVVNVRSYRPSVVPPSI